MKTAFILASLASVLHACNANTDNNTDRHDSSSHAAHNETGSHTQNNNQVNPVTETMDKMMHEMHNAKPTGNNDIDFAVMMVEHHKGAVEMSKVEVDQGTDTEMKAFAQKVINDQNKEIEFMQGLISKTSKVASPNSADFQKALNNSMMAMMNGNTTIYNNIDKDFATQMIPHHQSAVDMAKAYLQYSQETALRQLCQNIINAQAKEINWLKQWLVKNA